MPVAEWVYQSNDPLTVKLWAKQMLAQFAQWSFFLRISSKEDTSAVMVMDNLEKHAGDQVSFGESTLLTGAGVMGLNALTGNEESPQTFADALVINELCHAVLLSGPISNQRTLFDRRKIGRNRLADWYAARVDHAGANQLGSYTPQTDPRYTGLQAPLGTTRQILPTGVTDAATLASTNSFQITFWDTAVRTAKSLTNGIRPVKINGRDLFIGVMHPSQATDMRQSTSTGQWLDIEKAAMTGGDVGDNPIWWNALGSYHSVLMHEVARVTNAVSNAGAAVANTKRALFLGSQAAVLAFGRGQGESQKFRWLEELRDFGRQIGIGVSAIWGLVKVQFNAQDFAIIALDTYGLDIDPLGTAATNAQ
jgi:N4-gp56 family major capsid protein